MDSLDDWLGAFQPVRTEPRLSPFLTPDPDDEDDHDDPDLSDDANGAFIGGLDQ